MSPSLPSQSPVVLSITARNPMPTVHDPLMDQNSFLSGEDMSVYTIDLCVTC